ncbi:hypothetical protein PCG10_003126 [Penicillium crustosum]|uniref:RapZ C-terminal domain-containing protein n=1 Tax=Penicillium crustosum TaxID=36656 RepID=A0A9P5L238_PENCR|nr:uncharacterized protein N7487_000891 [Penicillium crustosum]KAF7527299.1 hypothetical protein PCG10_003126 [Penicillium crustosum]KAJ5417341.1 hypothetical protein N7487_000891 [Penicillium crustosum]
MIVPVGNCLEPSGRPSITVSLSSYGHANGPLVTPEIQEQNSILLSYNIRHLPNPPRNLRAMTTGLSPRLRKEFLKNEIVGGFLERAQNEIVNSLKTSCDALSQKSSTPEEPKIYGNEPEITTTSTHQKPNILLVVTVCCEEGRHRSVAFVEELAQRLSLLRDGADMSRSWKLSVTTFHRDLEALGVASNGLDSVASQQIGKSSAKIKREKGKDSRRLNQKNRNGYEDEMVQ